MRYALIGDSHGQVIVPALRKALTAAGHTVVLAEANPGWSSSRYLSDGIAARLRAARPDRVVVQLGGNDRQKDAEMATTLGAWRDAIVGAGADAIWFGPFQAIRDPHRGSHDTTAGILARRLPALGIRFVDTRPFSQEGHRDDGVHFRSYASIARAISDRLAQTLAAPRSSVRGWIALGVASAALVAFLLLRRRVT